MHVLLYLVNVTFEPEILWRHCWRGLSCGPLFCKPCLCEVLLLSPQKCGDAGVSVRVVSLIQVALLKRDDCVLTWTVFGWHWAVLERP